MNQAWKLQSRWLFPLDKQVMCSHSSVLHSEETVSRETATWTPSYTTSDVDGKQRPHSNVWRTAVYAFVSADVTVTFLSTLQTRHQSSATCSDQTRCWWTSFHPFTGDLQKRVILEVTLYNVTWGLSGDRGYFLTAEELMWKDLILYLSRPLHM